MDPKLVSWDIITDHPEERRFRDALRHLLATSETLDLFFDRLMGVLGWIAGDNPAAVAIEEELKKALDKSRKGIETVDDLIGELWARWWGIMTKDGPLDKQAWALIESLETENRDLKIENKTLNERETMSFMFSTYWRELRTEIYSQPDAARSLQLFLSRLQNMLSGARVYFVFDSESVLGNSIVQNIEELFDLTEQRYDDYMKHRATPDEWIDVVNFWSIDPNDAPEVTEFKLMYQLIESIRYESDVPVRVKRSGEREHDKFNYGDNILRIPMDSVKKDTATELLGKFLKRETRKERLGLSMENPIKVPTKFGTLVIFPAEKNRISAGILGIGIPNEDIEAIESKNIVPVHDLVEKVEGILGYCGESYRRQENQLDHLTGVPMRRAFHELADKKFSEWKSEGKTISMAMFDGDKFKRVNDTYGHPMGDLVIKEIAGSIKARIRSGDLAVRFGGEEFGILMPGKADAAARTVLLEAKKDLERKYFGYKRDPKGVLVEAVSNDPSDLLPWPKWKEQPIFQVTLSIWVADTDMGYSDLESLTKYADELLYQVKKRDWRNRIRFGDGSDDILMGEREVSYSD